MVGNLFEPLLLSIQQYIVYCELHSCSITFLLKPSYNVQVDLLDADKNLLEFFGIILFVYSTTSGLLGNHFSWFPSRKNDKT